MNNSIILNINRWLLFSLTLFLSVFERMVTPIILLLTIGAIIEFVTIKTKAKLNHGMVYSVLFYALFILGLSYSTNLQYGLADLSVKASFIAFPIIALLLSKSPSGKLEFAISGMIVGAIIGSSLCWGNFIYQYLKSGEFVSYGDFSIIMHPSYFSVNLVVSFVFIFYFLFLSKIKPSIPQKVAGILILIFFIGTILIVSSKTGIFTLIFVIASCAFTMLYRYKKIVAFISILGVAGLAFLTIKFNPRLNAALGSIRSIDIHKDQVYGTIQGRLFIWKQAKQVIEKNPFFGVGTGDVRDELFDNYKNLNIRFQDEIRLNCHNQYLETYLACGSFGCLFLIFFLLQPLFSRNRNFLTTIFVLIIALNLLFESMFNRQAGVILFALFYQLFWLRTSLYIPITIPILRNKKMNENTERILEEGIRKS